MTAEEIKASKRKADRYEAAGNRVLLVTLLLVVLLAGIGLGWNLRGELCGPDGEFTNTGGVCTICATVP